MVGIAQLAERLVVVQEVAGSSPVTHPNSSLSVLFAAACSAGLVIDDGQTGAMASPVTTSPQLDEHPLEVPLHAAEVPWTIVVWNDPVNLMTYVSWVFRRHFGVDALTADRLMMQVHTAGRATLAHGNRELMERHAEAMHEYGLWATVERAPR